MKTLTLREVAVKAAKVSVRNRKKNLLDAEKYRSVKVELDTIIKIASERKMTPSEVLQKLLQAIHEE